MQKQYQLYLIVLILGVLGCSSNPLEVDVSEVQIDFRFDRMDQEMIASSHADLQAVSDDCAARYGGWYDIYTTDMIRVGRADNPSIGLNLRQFVADPVVQETWTHISTKYANTDDLEQSFSDALRHYKYYYPDAYTPSVVCMHTGFNFGVYPTDSVIGIGLEMYLGPENEIVKSLPVSDFPQYVKDQMRREYITVDAMNVWLSNRFYDHDAFGNTFLSQMIFYGKVQYMLDAVMPTVADSVKLKFSADQLAWCEASEYSVWQTIIEKNLLYQTEDMEIRNWMSDAPFTKGLPRESPPRVGVWMGWKIVKAYVEANPDVSLQDLMAENNHQKILNAYKPEK